MSSTGKVALVTGGVARHRPRHRASRWARLGAKVVLNYTSNEAAAIEAAAAVAAAGGTAVTKRFDVVGLPRPSMPRSRKSLRQKAACTSWSTTRASPSTAGAGREGRRLEARHRRQPERHIPLLPGRAAGADEGEGRRADHQHHLGHRRDAAPPGRRPTWPPRRAIIGLTKTLAKEYASRGVTVNAVSPGFIETDMTANDLPADAARRTARRPFRWGASGNRRTSPRRSPIWRGRRPAMSPGKSCASTADF